MCLLHVRVCARHIQPGRRLRLVKLIRASHMDMEVLLCDEGCRCWKRNGKVLVPILY